jgi:isopenicillin N synthase-like dioxygenase
MSNDPSAPAADRTAAVITERPPVFTLAQLEREPERLDRACRSWGVFQLAGVREAPFDALDARARAFFALPAEHKGRIERTARNAWGWYDRELTKNVRDWKEIFDVGPSERSGPLAGSEPQWPEAPDGFRPAVEAAVARFEALSERVLAALARALGAPPARLGDAFRPAHTGFLRLNWYPPCPEPAAPEGIAVPERGHLGINHHTDAGALTLLLQDEVSALQVWRDGAWHDVPPQPGGLTVNLGDVAQVWSNDRWRAPLHRVRASASMGRLTAAWFHNPAARARYAPLPELVDPAHPPRYRPIAWAEFRAARAAGDFADQGEEIQIAHFRTPEV